MHGFKHWQTDSSNIKFIVMQSQNYGNFLDALINLDFQNGEFSNSLFISWKVLSHKHLGNSEMRFFGFVFVFNHKGRVNA